MTASTDPTNPAALPHDPQLNELVERGVREGRLSYRLLNDLLGDLEVDAEQLETLYEVLENRGVQLVDEPAPSADGAPQKSSPNRLSNSLHASLHATPAPTLKPGRHADLDDVVASLQELLAPEDLHLMEDLAGAAGEEDLALGVEDAYGQYVNRMARVSRLSPEEERRLAELVRRGTPAEQEEARQKLVEANLRLVLHIARRHAGQAALPLLDIVQEGTIGLIRAIDHFDPARGPRLGTYATWWIRQSINRAVSAQARSVRLPAQLSATIQKLQRLQRSLTQSMGRAPSRAELAQAAGISISQVDEALRAAAAPLSLEAPVGNEDDMELGETVSGSDVDAAEESFSRSQLRDQLAEVMQDLPERERVILMQRYGLGDYEAEGPQSLDDVAINMKLSRDRAHHLEVRALRKLRRRSSGTALERFFAVDDE